MSNAAKFEVPDSGDNGKTYVFSSGSDSHVLTSLAALYQPLDPDLTALAALTTTSFGRGLLELANAAALRTAAGVDQAGTAATAVAAHAAGTSVHGIADTSALLDTADIGVSVQAYSAVLAATTASFTTADETKLDGIEAAADVTDETNVVAALSGATLTDLGTPASGDKILLLDASDSDNLKTAAFSTFGGGGSLAAGLLQAPRTGGGYWHSMPFLSGTVAGTSWPTIDRLYGAPLAWPVDVSISALAINVTTAGSAGVVVRIAVFLLENGVPTTLLDQGTVAGDSTGAKTWTPSSAIDVPAGTQLVVFVGPQGTGSAGAAWFPAGASFPSAWTATGENGSSWVSARQVSMSVIASGALSSSPAVAVEQNTRMPFVMVRLA